MTPLKKPKIRRGFTLVELLIATAITALLVVLLASIISTVSQSWKRSEALVTRFQAARFAFERMTRSLSQATLNPYWDYLDKDDIRRTPANSANFVPKKYARCSDQHFLIDSASEFTPAGTSWSCYFQAPLGYTTGNSTTRLDNLLNAAGFFVEFNNDKAAATRSLKPDFITGDRWRYRLMDLREPSEALGVYQTTPTTPKAWISDAMGSGRDARPITENVIALVLLARDAAGAPVSSKLNSYVYDSRDKSEPKTWNQLPAQVQVVMVVIDEDTAARLAATNGTTAPSLVDPKYFKNPANFEQDLLDLESDLAANSARPDYRIFNATVRIEAAKWSD